MSQNAPFDLIVVGSGQGGGPLASAFAGAGRRVALIEREHVGGTCVNDGCTPTKTMVASARVAYLARRAADYGVHVGGVGGVSVNLPEVVARKAEVVAASRDGNQKSFEAQHGLELIWGEARFVGPKTLSVALKGGGTRTLEAGTVVLNVGQRPAIPKLEGLEGVPYLTSKTLLDLTTLPEHLVVLGGGYIGLEFAQMFRRFGSEVTILQRGPQLLGREDEDVAEAVAEVLREDGIAVHLGVGVARAESISSGVALTLEDGRQVRGSHLLVATGRTPNSDALGLSAAGVEADEGGYIKTNERLETNVPGVYALGDVKGGPAFTHISYDDFRVLKTNLLEGGDATIAGRPEPYTVFIDPQLGRVGLSEREAQEAGVAVKVARLPMSKVARAREVGETRGFMKVLVDAGTGRLVGAAILGLEGGEVMSALQIAMMGGLPYTALRDAPFAHPTLTESLNNLFMTLG